MAKDNRLTPKIPPESPLGQYLIKQSELNGTFYVDALAALLPQNRQDHLTETFNKCKGEISVHYPELNPKMEALFVIFFKCIVLNKPLDEDTITNLFLDLNAYSCGGEN